MTIRQALELRYQNQNPKCVALRESIIDRCQKFIYKELGYKDAEQKLCSKEDAPYWQQLSEVLLADQLDKAKIQFTDGRLNLQNPN